MSGISTARFLKSQDPLEDLNTDDDNDDHDDNDDKGDNKDNEDK